MENQDSKKGIEAIKSVKLTELEKVQAFKNIMDKIQSTPSLESPYVSFFHT